VEAVERDDERFGAERGGEEKKSENRSAKPEGTTKHESEGTASYFGFRPSFDIRHSAFDLHHAVSFKHVSM
jgi:hypothetical protein